MKRRFTEDSWRKEPWFRSLVSALASLKTEEDTANFLRDVGTLSELQAWSERLEVARLLARGYSYRQVAKLTGGSPTPVPRVAHFLENGQGGYRKILKAHRHHRMKPPTSLPEVGSPRGERLDDALPSEAESAAADHSHTHAPLAPREERPVSALQKYLERAK